MTSTDDVEANLAAAEALMVEAAERGAELVALPENFAYLRREGLPVPCAQALDGSFVAFLRAQARRHRIWLVGGTLPEAVPGGSHVHNTCVTLDPEGQIVALVIFVAVTRQLCRKLA